MKCYVECHSCDHHYLLSSPTGSFEPCCAACGSNKCSSMWIGADNVGPPSWYRGDIKTEKAKRFWEFWK